MLSGDLLTPDLPIYPPQRPRQTLSDPDRSAGILEQLAADQTGTNLVEH